MSVWPVAAMLALACEPAATQRPDAPPAEPPPSQAQAGPGVEVRDGRVWIRARGLSRARLLHQLAERGGFGLEAEGLATDRITLDLEDVELAAAVAAVVGGLPYTLAYTLDAGSGRHSLARLVVGEVAASVPRIVEPPPPPPPPPPRPPASPTPPARRSAEWEAQRDRLIQSLSIANLLARQEIVDQLDTSGPELEVLTHVLREDPDPEMRVLAAESLALADSYAATRSLLEALSDDDPAVLIAVLEALEFSGDESIVQYVVPLRDHPNPGVADAAHDALDFLE